MLHWSKKKKERTMTIKEPLDEDVQKSNDTSYDPYSTLGNEQTLTASSYDPFSILDQGNDPKNNILDPVTPIEVENNTDIAASTPAIGNDSHTPLLQGVPTNLLPLRFQRLLDVHNDYTRTESESVEFIPGYIPSQSALRSLLLVDLVITIALVQNWLIPGQPGRSGDTTYLNYIPIAVFAATIPVSMFMIFRIYKKRAPLRAKDSLGNPKPWPGDWKGGVYLVGSVAFLKFDPGSNKAWLFPLHTIVEVQVTSLEIRSGDETFNHEFGQLEDPEKGVQIQQWHHRCTNSTAEDP